MMKFDYEEGELSVYEDSEQINGMDCLCIWESKEGLHFSIREDNYDLETSDDGYGGTIFTLVNQDDNKPKEKVKFIIWDRQDKKFVKLRDHNIEKEQDREYFKVKGCSLWLENKVALDVFVIGEKGELLPYKGGRE